MADEAFALSPISARAAQPSAEDYDAISEAFMETSRGRWFLGEYAKRNRNADTRMVLDAVARIEETIAAQRQPQLPPDNGLAEALAAIRSALDDARAAASSVIDDLAGEQNLAPVRKGARIITEIAWRLREIGADGRICDLIDSQVSAIDRACGQISSAEPRGALSAAFDRIADRIGEFGERDAAAAVPQAAESAMMSPSPLPPGEMPAAASEESPTASATSDAEGAMNAPVAMSAPAFQGEVVLALEDAAEVTAEVADVPVEAAEVTATEAPEETTADAYDEAMLDMVALEMAAPDPSETSDISEIDADEIHVAEPPLAKPEIAALEIAAPEITAVRPEPVAAPAQPVTLQPSQAPRQPALEPSLGATLLANGIVQKRAASVSDPLAPIRRLSQAEKIAVFS
jgi:hypothetical protein